MYFHRLSPAIHLVEILSISTFVIPISLKIKKLLLASVKLTLPLPEGEKVFEIETPWADYSNYEIEETPDND